MSILIVLLRGLLVLTQLASAAMYGLTSAYLMEWVTEPAWLTPTQEWVELFELNQIEVWLIIFFLAIGAAIHGWTAYCLALRKPHFMVAWLVCALGLVYGYIAWMSSYMNTELTTQLWSAATASALLSMFINARDREYYPKLTTSEGWILKLERRNQ